VIDGSMRLSARRRVSPAQRGKAPVEPAPQIAMGQEKSVVTAVEIAFPRLN
jgi:hypothetical protein